MLALNYAIHQLPCSHDDDAYAKNVHMLGAGPFTLIAVCKARFTWQPQRLASAHQAVSSPNAFSFMMAVACCTDLSACVILLRLMAYRIGNGYSPLLLLDVERRCIRWGCDCRPVQHVCWLPRDRLRVLSVAIQRCSARRANVLLSELAKTSAGRARSSMDGVSWSAIG